MKTSLYDYLKKYAITYVIVLVLEFIVIPSIIALIITCIISGAINHTELWKHLTGTIVSFSIFAIWIIGPILIMKKQIKKIIKQQNNSAELSSVISKMLNHPIKLINLLKKIGTNTYEK